MIFPALPQTSLEHRRHKMEPTLLGLQEMLAYGENIPPYAHAHTRNHFKFSPDLLPPTLLQLQLLLQHYS